VLESDLSGRLAEYQKKSSPAVLLFKTIALARIQYALPELPAIVGTAFRDRNLDPLRVPSALRPPSFSDLLLLVLMDEIRAPHMS
jgi:hypothetical protein